MTTSLRIQKEALKFSAAHFLIFQDGTAERLHGHNYRVKAEIEAEDTETGILLDFRTFKNVLQGCVKDLDEYFLIPGLHPEIRVRRLDTTTEIRFRERFYAAPSNEVRVLPIVNTSAEEFARYLASAVADQLSQCSEVPGIGRLGIAVEETPGQEAWVQRSLDLPSRNHHVDHERFHDSLLSHSRKSSPQKRSAFAGTSRGGSANAHRLGRG